MKEVKIGPNDAGKRIDRFLLRRFPALKASLVQKYLRLKRIKRNGTRADASDKLAEGDLIQLYLGDELLEVPNPARAFLQIERPEVSVVYEDSQILLLDKPAGMLCHSDDREAVDTLLSHMQAYLHQKGEYRPGDEQSFAPALCNRIDRNTSGIVIAAKTAEALRILNEKIRAREIEKHYLCLVHGALSPPSGTLEGFLRRDLERKKVAVFSTPRPGARSAKTIYHTILHRNGVSLVECRLVTGRTHQIRAQMAAAGHPLVGDGKYGVTGRSDGRSHQALCSYRLRFAFESPAGALGYLNGREFRLEHVPFADKFLRETEPSGR